MTAVDSKWIIGEFEFTSFYISIPSPAKRNRGCRWTLLVPGETRPVSEMDENGLSVYPRQANSKSMKPFSESVETS